MENTMKKFTPPHCGPKTPEPEVTTCWPVHTICAPPDDGVQYAIEEVDGVATYVPIGDTHCHDESNVKIARDFSQLPANDPFASAPANQQEHNVLVENCIREIKDGSIFNFSIDDDNNITWTVNGVSTTVSVAAPIIRLTESQDGSEHRLFVNGVLVDTVVDMDTVSGELSFQPNANNGTDVFVGGTLIYTIPDTDTVINQTGNNYEFVEGGQVIGTITTIPDTDTTLVLGTQTVNADGSVEQCFTTVAADGSFPNGQDDQCFTLPAPSASDDTFFRTQIECINDDVQVTETDQDGNVVSGPTKFTAVLDTVRLIHGVLPVKSVPDVDWETVGTTTLTNDSDKAQRWIAVEFGGVTASAANNAYTHQTQLLIGGAGGQGLSGGLGTLVHDNPDNYANPSQEAHGVYRITTAANSVTTVDWQKRHTVIDGGTTRDTTSVVIFFKAELCHI